MRACNESPSGSGNAESSARRDADEGSAAGYRIVRVLGRGGMGEVCEAVRLSDGRRVALKSFTCTGSNREFLRKRFLAEGRLLLRLSHPGLVKVSDIAIDDSTERPRFAMDLVLDSSGNPCTLEDLRHRPGFDEAAVVQIYNELSDALRYLHANGVVHRDVKLENVLVDAAGHIRLADFGVSRIFDDGLRTELSVTTTMAADRAPIMGSIGYLSPELKRGDAATPASDAWALGVAVFRLLTGVWYEPDSSAEDLLVGFDPGWRTVLSRLLNPDPAKRLPIPVFRPGRTIRRRVFVFAMASVLVALAASLCAAFWHDRDESSGSDGSVFTTEGSAARLDLGRTGALDFVLCPPGPVDLMTRFPDGDPVRVEITRPYWIMKWPLTRFNSAFYPPLYPPEGLPDDGRYDNYVCLNHMQAAGLVEFFNERLGKYLPDGYEIRLPTLAEWERAFHADATAASDPFFDLTTLHCNDSVHDAVYYDYNANAKQREKAANAWGIGDWCGQERVADTFDPSKLLAPDRAEHPSFYLVEGLPAPPSLRDAYYRCASRDRVHVIRLPGWVRWKVCTDEFAEDWAPLRLVVGPRLEGDRNAT